MHLLISFNLSSFYFFHAVFLCPFPSREQYNTTLRNIVWRLESRQSFKINRMLTRNKDIYRRLQEGRTLEDMDEKIQHLVASSPASSPLRDRPKVIISLPLNSCTYTFILCMIVRAYFLLPLLGRRLMQQDRAARSTPYCYRSIPVSALLPTHLRSPPHPHQRMQQRWQR